MKIFLQIMLIMLISITETRNIDLANSLKGNFQSLLVQVPDRKERFMRPLFSQQELPSSIFFTTRFSTSCLPIPQGSFTMLFSSSFCLTGSFIAASEFYLINWLWYCLKLFIYPTFLLANVTSIKILVKSDSSAVLDFLT